jgi:hypothetical protein
MDILPESNVESPVVKETSAEERPPSPVRKKAAPESPSAFADSIRIYPPFPPAAISTLPPLNPLCVVRPARIQKSPALPALLEPDIICISPLLELLVPLAMSIIPVLGALAVKISISPELLFESPLTARAPLEPKYNTI